MKLKIQELHYISIIVDSIIDFGQIGLNRKDIYEYMKDWIMSYKMENNIEEMTKENFLEISDKCIEDFHLNRLSNKLAK